MCFLQRIVEHTRLTQLPGGNQRETDRLKAQKKLANIKKTKESASSLAKVSVFQLLHKTESVSTSDYISERKRKLSEFDR